MKKDFTPGEIIPEDSIAKLYKDKDYGILICELKGVPDFFYRITDDYRFLFKTNRSTFPEKDLELLKSNENETQPVQKKSDSIPDYLKPYLKKAYILKNDDGIEVYNEQYIFLGSIRQPKIVDKKSHSDFEATHSAMPKPIDAYEEDDILPEEWQIKCKKTSKGFKLKTERFLLVMDQKYYITKKIALTQLENESPTSEFDAIPIEYPESLPRLTGKDVKLKHNSHKESDHESNTTVNAMINTVIEKTKKVISMLQMQVEFFVDKRLAVDRIEILKRVYQGELGDLNEDTQAAKESGNKTHFKGGFSFFKAALVHELYIHSTLKGRSIGETDMGYTGRKMKELLTFFILLQKDGSLKEMSMEISLGIQKKIINFISDQSKKYTDKYDVLQRIHRKLVYDLENGELVPGKKDIILEKFKALLIYKLYENTNRLERGSGVTIINLCRDIIDIKLVK